MPKRYAGNKPELSDISRQHSTKSSANRAENALQSHPEAKQFARAHTDRPQQPGTGSPDLAFQNRTDRSSLLPSCNPLFLRSFCAKISELRQISIWRNTWNNENRASACFLQISDTRFSNLCRILPEYYSL